MSISTSYDSPRQGFQQQERSRPERERWNFIIETPASQKCPCGADERERKIGRKDVEVHLRNCYSTLCSPITSNTSRRAFLPSQQGGPCLSCHPEQPQICSWPRWPRQHLISPQIPRRRQTYSAVIDGRSAKKGCGEGEGSSNGLLTRKPASSAPMGA